jgi:hypothetical protein
MDPHPMPDLPAPFAAARLAEEVRVATALGQGRVVTLEEVAEAAGLPLPEARLILRDFARAGLVTMQVMSSGSCSGRREAAQYFYARTAAAGPAFRAAAEALAATPR